MTENLDWKDRIEEMARGYQGAAVLLNALRAGVFETLGEGEMSAAQVAAAGGLDLRATDAVLRALAVLRLVEVVGGNEERFRVRDEARPFLLAAGAETMTSILGHNLFLMRNWAHLDHTLRTGEPPRREERSPQQTRDFILGMENVSRHSSKLVAERVDLSGARRLLDLGGGPGTAALTFARMFPQLQCVVFDLPEPVAIAREQVAAVGLADRVTVQAGDFHSDELGTGYDVVYISNIIHMMDARETGRLLGKAHAALVAGGRLVLKDFFLEDSRLEPAGGVMFNVNMLAMTRGGKTYTRREVLALLEEAGFSSPEIQDVAVRSQIIICRK